MHRVPVHGAAVPAAEAWATPLGEVPIDASPGRAPSHAAPPWTTVRTRPSTRWKSSCRSCSASSRTASRFLPVAVSEISAKSTADLIGEFLGETGTLVLVSSDLSHYHDLDTARRLDRTTADAILAREPENLSGEDACGYYPLRGLLELARRRSLPIRMLDLRTSGDTAGDPVSVVGYGAFEVGSGEKEKMTGRPRILRMRLTNPF